VRRTRRRVSFVEFDSVNHYFVASVLVFLTASFVAVGNLNAINRAYEDGSVMPIRSFFDPVWNNTAYKVSFLFFVCFGFRQLLFFESWESFLYVVVMGSVVLGLLGALVGIVCAVAAYLGSRLSRVAAVTLSTLALYGQLFFFLLLVGKAG